MSWNKELKQIRKELNRGIHNNDVAYGDDVTFIEYTKIQEVWAGDRLDRFLRDPACDPDHGTDKAISKSQIEEARSGLLWMISLLIGIFWEDWSRFKEIFFLYPRAVNERRDRAIKDLGKNELEHATFLGDPDVVRQFLRDKWIYTPLILNADKKQRVLVDHPRGTRLPLVRQENSEPLRGGAFGEVTKEKILPGHIFLRQPSSNLGVSDQVNSTELTVARKRFTNGRSDVEYRQLEFLQSSLCRHERIVYPLATVKIDNTLNIIMPWADMDLHQYIQYGYKLMNPGNLLLQDIIEQSVELAGALEFLHGGLQGIVDWPKLPQQGICHGDFTPKNILIFNHGKSVTGDWAITDFGVSQQAFLALTTGRHGPGLSNTNHALLPPLGGIYQAPEVHAQLRSDIWSFGCILVQLFALGIEHGDPYSGYRASTPSQEVFHWQKIKERFCVQVGDSFILNPNVHRWIQSLKVQYCNLYNIKILSKMQDLLWSMLKIDFHDRAHAAEVRGRLYEIYRIAFEQGLGPPTDPNPIASLPSIIPQSPTISPPSIPTPPTTPGGSIRRASAQLPDQSQISFLVNNINTGNVDNVKHCLQLQPDVDVERVHGTDRPLIHAIEKRSVAMIHALWEHKPNLDVITPSSQNVTPLFLAVTKGDLGMVKILIDIIEEHDPSKEALNHTSLRGMTPLMAAASGKCVAVVSELLNRGANTTICVGEEQKNCLHFAVENIEAQEDLIKAFVGKMDFNMSPGTYGYETPMMRHINLGVHESYGASSVNLLWKLKFYALREGNANVNLKYGTGKSPVQLALQFEKFDIARILVDDAGAELPPGAKVPSDKKKHLGSIFNMIERIGKRTSGR